MARHWLGIGAVTIAGFAAWLTYELTRPPVVPEPPAPAADAPLGELPGLETEAPALASLHVTLERPLFDEDRRPNPPADAAGPGADKPEAGKPLPMRLSAVIVGADGRRSVLVEISGEEQSQRVGAGDQVAGWRVDEISDDAVVLNAGGQRTVVPLRTFKEPSPDRPSARPAAQRRGGDAARRQTARATTGAAAAPQAEAAPNGQQPEGAIPQAPEQSRSGKRN